MKPTTKLTFVCLPFKLLCMKSFIAIISEREVLMFSSYADDPGSDRILLQGYYFSMTE